MQGTSGLLVVRRRGGGMSGPGLSPKGIPQPAKNPSREERSQKQLRRRRDPWGGLLFHHHLQHSSHIRPANSCFRHRGEKCLYSWLNPLNPSCANSRQSMETTESRGQQPHRGMVLGWGGWGGWRQEDGNNEGGTGESSQVSISHTSLSFFPSSCQPLSCFLHSICFSSFYLLSPLSWLISITLYCLLNFLLNYVFFSFSSSPCFLN